MSVSGNFNPRARMGARLKKILAIGWKFLFQSTRPHGGATGLSAAPERELFISIHAPAWGRDDVQRVIEAARQEFQSTRPHGGATCRFLEAFRRVLISIHAPAWGRDMRHLPRTTPAANFNPRARMGARLFELRRALLRFLFQSTRPHGGATLSILLPPRNLAISIHAPAWGRDAMEQIQGFWIIISIHAPAWGRDRHRVRRSLPSANFNPRARMGARLMRWT